MSEIDRGVKTNPTTAPPSLTGVVHQARNLLASAPSASGLPMNENRASGGQASLRASQHLAELEKNIISKRAGQSQDLMRLDAAKAADRTSQAERYLHMQEPDTIEKVAYGAAAVTSFTHAGYVLSKHLGWEGPKNILGKLPWLKSVVRADAIADKMLEEADTALEQQDDAQLMVIDQLAAEVTRMRSSMHILQSTWNKMGRSPEEVDRLMVPFQKNLESYIGNLQGYLASTGGY